MDPMVNSDIEKYFIRAVGLDFIDHFLACRAASFWQDRVSAKCVSKDMFVREVVAPVAINTPPDCVI
jgi:hypothetical protein